MNATVLAAWIALAVAQTAAPPPESIVSQAVVEAPAERVTGRTLPRGAVTQPCERTRDRPQPARGRGKSLGEHANGGRVAGQRCQTAHHGPPDSERDTPVSVST